MRGIVLTYDTRTGTGLISGDDGIRYTFAGTDVVQDFDRLRAGGMVDFEVNGTQAIQIYAVGSAAAQQVGQKSKVVAGLLAIFLGGLGIHKFYIGANVAGIIMLLCTLFGFILAFIPTLIVGLIALIEGVIYLTRSDEDFYETYEVKKKAWF